MAEFLGRDPRAASVETALAGAAAGLREELRGAHTPAARLEALRRAVHQELGLAMEADPRLEEKPRSFLPGDVLARRQGACLGLSLIYLSLARRVGLPLVGVSLPGHFFVRLRGAETVWNLETTLGGVLRPDARYAQDAGLELAAPPGNYLRDLSPREVLGEVLNNAGAASLRAGRPDQACQLLARACALGPEDPDAHYNLALAQRARGDAAATAQALERSLELHEDAPAARTLRGLLHLEAGDPRAALPDLEAALARDPREPRYWNNRGSARCALGDLLGGVEDFGRALELCPPDRAGRAREARQNRALARLQLGLAAEAGEDLTALPEGCDWEALFARLPATPLVADALGRLAEALPPAAAGAALLAAGEACLALDDPRAAHTAFSRALRARSRDVAAYCGRSRACERLGDQLWAKRNFVLAMQADPTDPRGYRCAADYYLRRDAYAVAADYLREYLRRVAPDAPGRADAAALVREIEEALGQ